MLSAGPGMPTSVTKAGPPGGGRPPARGPGGPEGGEGGAGDRVPEHRLLGGAVAVEVDDDRVDGVRPPLYDGFEGIVRVVGGGHGGAAGQVEHTVAHAAAPHDARP